MWQALTYEIHTDIPNTVQTDEKNVCIWQCHRHSSACRT